MKTGKKGQTRVVIYGDWCKGCGICAAFCPGSVMEISVLGKAVVVREDECINCGFCELHCPDFAISVRPRERRTGAAPGPEAGPGKPDEPGSDPEAGSKPGSKAAAPRPSRTVGSGTTPHKERP